MAVVSRQSSVVSRAAGVVRLRALRNRLARYAIATVDPVGKILKFAALAAERRPGRVCRRATAQDTYAGHSPLTIDLKIERSIDLRSLDLQIPRFLDP